MINWLLLFAPLAVGLEHVAPERYLLIFLTSGLAILPLAAWMGRATEHLAERMGEGIGGLLNATFGNAAELIIALAALRVGLYDVVKASIIGSIVGISYWCSAWRCWLEDCVIASSVSTQQVPVPRRRC